MEEKLMEYARAAYDQKEKETGPQDMRLLERLVMLRVIDEPLGRASDGYGKSAPASRICRTATNEI